MPSVRPGDFRSEAKDHRRIKDHNTKWQHGSLPAAGKHCYHLDPYGWSGPCDACAKRPAHSRSTWLTCCDVKAPKAKKQTVIKQSLRRDFHEALDDDSSDNSAAEDVAVAPEPDNEIMYSFDAHAGPGQGSQVLGHAILRAVERYENKETEKMVQEYDLVVDGKDEDMEFADAEDDFELVDSTFHTK